MPLHDLLASTDDQSTCQIAVIANIACQPGHPGITSMIWFLLIGNLAAAQTLSCAFLCYRSNNACDMVTSGRMSASQDGYALIRGSN